ncbi:MAG TPA: phosphoenolpyruvate--protein phosphotransferase [Geminicoccaceae bacterium]|nr:phosphoenolpyruvate--protein phosphotransferase [Geminicoccaceae bacterium]
MAERVLRGRSASPGLAIGPLVRLPKLRVRLGRPAVGRGVPRLTIREELDPDAERARLDKAIARARDELSALAAAADDMGADILEFQLELLDDPTLVREARAEIAGGAPAQMAWMSVLQRQIMSYEDAEHEYFQARAGDLRDVAQRVHRALGNTEEELATLPPGAVLLDDDLAPSRFLSLDWSTSMGVALERGSPSSHVAMLARARGVPMVTNLGEVLENGEAVLDAGTGTLIVRPDPATRRRYAEELAARRAEDSRASTVLARPALTAGGERVEVMVNVDDPGAVGDGILSAADGVGLFRTEFLFLGRDRLPGEAEQLAAYVGLLDRLDGKPCTVRTLDVGGDKPLPGVTVPQESNPFLGLRGLRLCLERPELFRPQVRALLRAAPGRPLKVMLPMVATAGELEEARAFFAACLDELAAEGVAAAMPPLGIMVETPAAAITVDLLPADFWSIGSNDLTQYVMAASRDAGGRVGALLDPLQPAVLRLIEGVVRHGAATGIPVSLCGDMASEPACVEALLKLGLRHLSVAPAALGRVKLAVAAFGAAHG